MPASEEQNGSTRVLSFFTNAAGTSSAYARKYFVAYEKFAKKTTPAPRRGCWCLFYN